MICALSRGLHLNTQCTRIGSLLVQYQLEHQKSSSRSKDPQEARKTKRVETTRIFGKEIGQIKSKAKVKMI